MRIVSSKILGLSMAAGAAIAAVGVGAHPAVIDTQAAPATPVHASPTPPSPPPQPPPARNNDQNQDYWSGQGSGGGAPGAGGGAGGAGGGG